MTAINFSVPEGSDESITKKLAIDSKNDVLGRLLQEAREAKTMRERRSKAIEAILEYRKTAPYVSDEEVHRIRQEIRDSVFVD